MRWIRDAAIFAAALYAVEMFGSTALVIWVGASTDVFRLVGWQLARLFAAYVLLGALVGATLAAIAALAWRRRRPSIVICYALIAGAFASIGLAWNAEGAFPRRFYLHEIAATLAVVFMGCGVVWLQRRVPGRIRIAAAAVAIGALAIGSGLSVHRPGDFGLRMGNRGTDPADGAGLQATAQRLPNIVLIVLDTVRADHLSAYGYTRATSPAIDRVAAEGTLFTRAFSTASWTLPAHVSLLTGLYPSTHGTDIDRIRLAPGRVTLAQLAASRGYRTALFSANAWLSAMTRLDRGFARAQFAGADALISNAFAARAAERLAELTGADRADMGARTVTAGLVAEITAAAHSKTPFFLMANYMEAHEPYGTVPASYAFRFVDRGLPWTAGRVWVRDTPLFLCASCEGVEAPTGLSCDAGRWSVAGERVTSANGRYDAGIRYVDDQVGQIYRELERSGVLDDTLLIITSDHGESLGEHGRFGHGGYLQNTVLHVPLIVRYPRQFARGARPDAAVSLVDVYPTIREALELNVMPSTDGMSLTRMAELQQRPVRIVAEYSAVSERVWRAAGRRLGCDYARAGRRAASLQTADFKYIWSSDGRNELYDLGSDPGERHNLIVRRSDTAARLHAELHDVLLGLAREETAEPPREVDPAVRDLLRSLGYVR
jgi:arylsulfatase A-like enzyme